ncbi:DEAD/DEAH box helicase family protein [Candidatus Pelagibacter sp.]|jgi:superfamily II DNA or RNA helicase|nr:DEAD/DEAH box helicase family protein [Candidatus Pelagibacter sp.]
MDIKLRDWQIEASKKCLNWYFKNNDNKFVINAAPGTGKTICSISIVNELIKQDQIDRVIVIAPQSTVVKQWASKYKELTGRWMQKTTDLTEDKGIDICCTWASVKNLLDGFQKICNEKRTLVICDEHHHAAVQAAWGVSADGAFKNAKYILILTGTPIRSDSEEPVWFTYKGGQLNHPKDGMFTLTYGESIRLGYCRPIAFGRHEANFNIFDTKGGQKLGAVSGKGAEEIEEAVKGTYAEKMLQESNRFYSCAITPVYNNDKTPDENSYQASMLREGIAKLEDRKNRLPVAGGLVIAPNIETAEYMGKLIEKLTNKKPVVVHTGPTCDNPGDEIERFDKVNDNDWIVSVDMIGEGVDIQRLRVLVYLPRARTELKFRQAMGRVVRKYEGIAEDDSSAYVVMPAFEIFDQYARRVMDEMPGEHLKPPKPTKKCPSCETENKRESKKCISKSCDHEFPTSETRFKKCKDDKCGALNPIGAKSCQECGEEFGVEFDIALTDVFREGGISGGFDISEEEMEGAENISDAFYDMAKISNNPAMLRLLKEHTPESLMKFYDEIGKMINQAKKMDKN